MQLRTMLRRLNNSHIFLYSREEWTMRQNVLPMLCETVGERVFVRHVLGGLEGSPLCTLALGDELMSVDGVRGDHMRPLTLARLEEIRGNPNFGGADSMAVVRFRRGRREYETRVRRVNRPAGFQNASLEVLAQETGLLRFFTLGRGQLPDSALRSLWSQVVKLRRLAIDLRGCVGGDPEVSNFIAGSLLGPDRLLFVSIPRPGDSSKRIESRSADSPRFSGRVAVLVNSNTESQPEALAAVCQENGCGRIFGERTAGALNGFTEALAVPGQFIRCAIPYTRSVSAKGMEYEGKGIEPDEVVKSSAADFRRKRDRPLEAALAFLRG